MNEIKEDNMLNKQGWKEFRKTGMLFLTNSILQFFGWSIVFEYSNEKLIVYPAKSKYRGFSEDVVRQGHKAVAKYLKDNINELYSESEE